MPVADQFFPLPSERTKSGEILERRVSLFNSMLMRCIFAATSCEKAAQGPKGCKRLALGAGKNIINCLSKGSNEHTT